MRCQVTPGAFYGSAIAALSGLALGLMLHTPWQDHSAGPQLLTPSAATAALAEPASDDAPPPASANAQLADADTGYVEPDPLPVTRLDPDRFDPKPAAEEVARQDVDDEQETADAQPAPAVQDFD